jgi:hypothetical protein
MKIWTYFLPAAKAVTDNGFVASIFFDFFKVFLAILFPPHLICPDGHRRSSMQSNRQTSLPLRSSATCSICETSRHARSEPIGRHIPAALN